MEATGLISFLIIGAIAGWLGSTIMKGGGFGLLGRGVPALAFFPRERDRGPHALSDELHEARNDPLVRVDARAGQHFAPVARARPTGDLFGPVAVFLVISDGVI